MPVEVDQMPAMVHTSAASSQFMLLTGTAPGEPGVGGVILRDLIHVAGPDTCSCFWLSPRGARHEPFMSEVRTTVHTRRFETAYRPVRGILGEAISATAMSLLRPWMIHGAASRAEHQIRQTNPSYLLAVLESPAAIQVALTLHRRTGIPLRSIVWDDVDVICRQGLLDRWTRRQLERSFHQVLRASERVAVICEAMRDAYQQEHGIESFVLRHGMPLTTSQAHTSDRTKRDYDLIGFAGSVTAPDCLRSLISALDQVEWRLNGREIALRFIGSRYILDTRRPQRIEFFGWRSVTETRELLAACDVLYLPQTFDVIQRRLSELSFPTKLSTYVAANRPVFLHSPEYASLSEFWQRFDLGPHCREIESSRVLETLRQTLGDGFSQNEQWTAEVRRSHEAVFCPRQFEDGVRELTDG